MNCELKDDEGVVYATTEGKYVLMPNLDPERSKQ